VSISSILCSWFHIGCVVTSPGPVSPTQPSPVVSNPSVQSIVKIATDSSCITYKWQDRGFAPKGYIKGMAVMYARELCRKGDAVAAALTKPVGSSATDALAVYGLSPTLTNLFTLETGLGMRESSGCYSIGYDASAGPETSLEAEAGLFQMSANAVSASVLVQPLLNGYVNNSSKCLTEIFSEGSSCPAQKIIGSGIGASYQSLVKSCPAAAVESTAIVLRVLRKHWGPLNRKEAEVYSGCGTMFNNVAAFVSANPSICGAL
jgi:hypothetical protein